MLLMLERISERYTLALFENPVSLYRSCSYQVNRIGRYLRPLSIQQCPVSLMEGKDCRHIDED